VRFHIGPLPTTLLEIFLLLFLAAWIYERRFNGIKSAWEKLHKSGWVIPLVLWLLAGVIGIFVAPGHMGALGLWRAYFLEPILIFVMLADLVRSNEDRRHLIRSLIFVTGIVALWALIQFVSGHGIPAPWDKPPQGIRATGPFPYPNALALFAVPISALCFYLVVNKKSDTGYRIPDIILWLGFASGLIATLLAKSDGGFIALLAAMFVTLLIKKATRLPVIAIAIVSLILAFSFPMSRSTITNQIFFKDWSGKVRLVMWEETQNMLADRPILGAGLGAYPKMIQPYHEATWMEVFQYPHNILLNLWSEVGLLGILAFTWILILWYKKSGLAALPILAVILVHGLVDVPYFKNDLAILFWILIATTTTGNYPSISKQQAQQN